MNELEQMKVLRESIERLEEGTYWENKGAYENEARELMKLVPDSGPAKTLRGELMRAASKIYYDYHNNGFGNSWAEAAQFLMNVVAFDDDVKEMLWDHAMGNLADGDEDAIVEKMLSTTIEQIYTMPDQKNPGDMWDTQVDTHKFQPEYDERDQDDWDDPDDYDEEDDEDY
jgi:hypothetical protein